MELTVLVRTLAPTENTGTYLEWRHELLQTVVVLSVLMALQTEDFAPRSAEDYGKWMHELL